MAKKQPRRKSRTGKTKPAKKRPAKKRPPKKQPRKNSAANKQVIDAPTSKPTSIADQVTRELAAAALDKRRRGETPTTRELRALRKIEKQREEEQRERFYHAVPRKHYRALSGRADQVLNQQADRFGLPLRGPVLDLYAVVKGFHDLLARLGGRKKLIENEDGLIEFGSDSADREDYWKWKSRNERLKFERDSGQVIPSDRMHQFLQRIAGLIRDAGDELQRLNPDAFEIFEALHDNVDTLVERFFPTPDESPEHGRNGEHA